MVSRSFREVVLRVARSLRRLEDKYRYLVHFAPESVVMRNSIQSIESACMTELGVHDTESVTGCPPYRVRSPRT